MRPSEVASVLGLDRTETIVAVALADGDFIDTATADVSELLTAPAGEQRLRRVI